MYVRDLLRIVPGEQSGPTNLFVYKACGANSVEQIALVCEKPLPEGVI